ncbi:Crp/Fnr family transcriptional regulator [Flavobacterium selenitireducens]|uniref:Crp/Fnr family transcriptional regulator n=1 Tax=Flavobacterium selenitireducens TaxID=2722704 RepID=UPI00168B7480|nr:Crp/Fnr family transcriptional regulator [Flavobacterium selenitireducens]MBD3582124.1 Crp/Fnr family transcriptional regulator [Flavobacterium selenitireducens]
MEFFDTLYGFSPGESRKLQDLIELPNSGFRDLRLKKNEFLVPEGEICRYFCLIKTGILQHAITVSGEEKTTYIGMANSITSSLGSFLFQKPSRKSVKALSDTHLLVIDRENFGKLLAENPEFHKCYYELLERQLCLIDDYRIDLLTLSPEDRYAKLLETEPDLIKEVPLHHLASFLGISTRHMSRIRKSVLK